MAILDSFKKVLEETFAADVVPVEPVTGIDKVSKL